MSERTLKVWIYGLRNGFIPKVYYWGRWSFIGNWMWHGKDGDPMLPEFLRPIFRPLAWRCWVFSCGCR